ncbi:hypothetical protein PCE1_000179 [Barthelona sp. PCE]
MSKEFVLNKPVKLRSFFSMVFCSQSQNARESFVIRLNDDILQEFYIFGLAQQPELKEFVSMLRNGNYTTLRVSKSTNREGMALANAFFRGRLSKKLPIFVKDLIRKTMGLSERQNVCWVYIALQKMYKIYLIWKEQYIVDNMNFSDVLVGLNLEPLLFAFKICGTAEHMLLDLKISFLPRVPRMSNFLDSFTNLSDERILLEFLNRRKKVEVDNFDEKEEVSAVPEVEESDIDIMINSNISSISVDELSEEEDNISDISDVAVEQEMMISSATEEEAPQSEMVGDELSKTGELEEEVETEPVDEVVDTTPQINLEGVDDVEKEPTPQPTLQLELETLDDSIPEQEFSEFLLRSNDDVKTLLLSTDNEESNIIMNDESEGYNSDEIDCDSEFSYSSRISCSSPLSEKLLNHPENTRMTSFSVIDRPSSVLSPKSMEFISDDDLDFGSEDVELHDESLVLFAIKKFISALFLCLVVLFFSRKEVVTVMMDFLKRLFDQKLH